MTLRHIVSADAAAQRWPALVRVMLGRLAMLGCLFVALVALIPRDATAFYAFVGLAFVINVPYALWLRDDSTARRSAPLQFLADTLIVSGLVHFTGGINSELCLLYPLVIVSAGIVASGRLSVKITLLTVVLYSTVLILEMRGLLAYLGDPPWPYAHPEIVMQRLMLRVFVFVIFCVASSYLATTCTYQARQLGHYRNLMQAVFSHVPVGLFVVRPDGQIVVANQAAARLLATPEERLPGRRVVDYMPESAATPEALAQRQDAVVQVRRADGTRFPAAIDVARASLPVSAPESRPSDDEPAEQDVWLLVMRDMTEALAAEAAVIKMAEMGAAFRMAADMADQIRNPVAAIQAAGEALTAIMRPGPEVAPPDGRAGAWQGGTTITTLRDVILKESKALDERVERFLDCTTDAPACLAALAAVDGASWGPHPAAATAARANVAGAVRPESGHPAA